jgi:hypothetical protein
MYSMWMGEGGSERLTKTEVLATNCTFACSPVNILYMNLHKKYRPVKKKHD